MTSAPTLAIVRPPSEEGGDGLWWRFSGPLESHVAPTPEEVPGLLERVERATGRGLWAVGFVAYEAAPAFDPALATQVPSAGSNRGPLAAFSLFPPPQKVAPPAPGVTAGADLRAELLPGLGEAEHAVALATIREAIAAGETYQVNFTFPLRGSFTGDPEALFWQLAPASAAPHAAFLDCGDSGHRLALPGALLLAGRAIAWSCVR